MFDWGEYFKLAEDLSKQAINSLGNEAYLRTAVSRAYYAAYHKAKKFAEKTDNVLFAKIKNEPIIDLYGNNRRRGDHEAIAEFLKICHSQFYYTEGATLERLHKDRIDCDYHDNIKTINLANTNKSIEMARSIMSQIP